MTTLIHFIFGMAMVAGWGDFAGQDRMAGLMGWFFILFAGVFILSGWAFAVCLVMAGRFLSKQQHYTFCLVMAAIACMFMPFGTVLGVFTIIVLIRESVKDLFSHGETPVAEA